MRKYIPIDIEDRNPSDKISFWVCNECNSIAYTLSISEDDLKHLQCLECGCCEFHVDTIDFDI